MRALPDVHPGLGRERMIAALERKIAATEGSKDGASSPTRSEENDYADRQPALFVQIDALNRKLVYYAPPDYGTSHFFRWRCAGRQLRGLTVMLGRIDWRCRFRGPTKAR